MTSRTTAASSEQQANIERASDGPAAYGGAPRHQPELDGIRGVAILGVLLTHASAVIAAVPDTGVSHWVILLTTPLWGGVDLFFALSGFLITGILLRGLQKPNYFKSFYARRALRIFPIYYLFLTLSLVLCAKFPPLASLIANSAASLPDSIPSKLSYFVYLQNLPFFWPTIATGLTGLWGAFWSLAVEEQFYVVWPTLVRWVQLRWLYGLCLLQVALAPWFRLWLATHLTGASLGLLHFPGSRLDGLFAGAALALYRRFRGKPLPLQWALCWLITGLAILFWIGFSHPVELMQTGPLIDTFGISGYVLAGTGLIAASQNNLPVLKQVLSWRPLTVLGKYSYGIYVYHLSVFFFFRGRRAAWIGDRFSHPALGYLLELAAIGASVCIAMLSYRYIESPFLALKVRFPSAADSAESRSALVQLPAEPVAR